MTEANSRYKLWYCWDHDNQERSSATRIEESEAPYAAELFCHDYYNQNAADIRNGPISVSVETEDGEVKRFTVNIDFSPSFHASEDD